MAAMRRRRPASVLVIVRDPRKRLGTLRSLSKPTVNRVVLNAVFLQRRTGGIETYIRELVHALPGLRPRLSVTLVTQAGREVLADESWADEVESSSRILALPMTKAVSELIQFIWRRAAEETLDVYERAARQR
jgi:hypothetical protein